MTDVVCGVIENSAGSFLACQRPEGKHLAGLWEFPGGKVDTGESPQEALIRELYEELAVDVEVGLPLEPVLWADHSISIRLLPFRCKIVRGDPQALEHARLLWCQPDNFGRLTWAEADLPILRQIRDAV